MARIVRAVADLGGIDAAPASAPRHAIGRASQVALLAAPVVVLAWQAWQRRWMSDDGLINLRVVDQVLAGNGPVFNAGERVEAATSPLWVALLAVGDVVLPLRLEWIAVLGGIGLTVAGVAAATVASARLWRVVDSGVLVPAGALCLAVLSPVWDFSSSGLEGGLGTAWLGGSLWALERWAARDDPSLAVAAVAAVVAGLGPVVRPDFAVLSAVLVLALLLGERRAPIARRVQVVGLALAVPVAYELFRIGYFGALVPNTYFAKEGGESNWAQGWHYLADLVGPYRLWLPLAVLGAGAAVPLVVLLRRRGAERAALVAAAFPVGGLLTALAVVRGGGDFMHGRMLLPPLFAMLAPVATVAVRRSTAAALAVLPWAVLCLAAFESPGGTPRHGISDARAMLSGLLHVDHLVTIEDFGYGPGGTHTFAFDGDHRLYVGSTPVEVDGRPVPLAAGAPEHVVISYGVGAVGYFVGPDTYVLDMLGLGDAMAARQELRERGPYPGHEKGLPPAWVWARFVEPAVEPDPALIVPPGVISDVSPTLADAGAGDFGAEVAAAREALRCGGLAELQEAVRAGGAGAVAGNVDQALGGFGFRFPSRPSEARAELC